MARRCTTVFMHDKNKSAAVAATGAVEDGPDRHGHDPRVPT
ncbi:hypothetical protein HJC23_011810 [Cyclotella cryptica]|uniref:Uncharacterized protein n=1 Tax=Cyclotella cryptica TaxID=29204 RepID=A0ABD3NUW9_9STRA